MTLSDGTITFENNKVEGDFEINDKTYQIEGTLTNDIPFYIHVDGDVKLSSPDSEAEIESKYAEGVAGEEEFELKLLQSGGFELTFGNLTFSGDCKSIDEDWSTGGKISFFIDAKF